MSGTDSPIEPPPSTWAFPRADSADADGVVGVGADVDPGTLLTAYRSGLFPMPVEPGGPMVWWSPDPRGVLEVNDLQVSRSMRRSLDRYEVRIDTAFAEVMVACADPTRERGWIDEHITGAYGELPGVEPVVSKPPKGKARQREVQAQPSMEAMEQQMPQMSMTDEQLMVPVDDGAASPLLQ